MSKEKQIEEIAKFICNACEMGCGFEGECCLDNDYKTCYSSKITACAIYNAGYRKQEEAVWEFHKDGSGTCSRCHHTQKAVYDDDHYQAYCGVCGSKMKGV